MATVIAGTFADCAAAQEAVEQLQAAGIPTADISLVARDIQTHRETMVTGADLPHGSGIREEVAPAVDAAAVPSPAVKGAEIGGISGLLIGLGALTGPGSLPIVAAGTLLAALGGAAVGAAAGGLVGALVELGVPEEHATIYAADVERGHVLLAVRTDAALPVQVREIMAQAGALNLYPARPAPSEASSG